MDAQALAEIAHRLNRLQLLDTAHEELQHVCRMQTLDLLVARRRSRMVHVGMGALLLHWQRSTKTVSVAWQVTHEMLDQKGRTGCVLRLWKESTRETKRFSSRHRRLLTLAEARCEHRRYRVAKACLGAWLR